MIWWATLGDFEDSCGRIVELRLDSNTFSTRELVSYQPEPQRAVPGKGFTGGFMLSNKRALVCGFNAVYDVTEQGVKPYLVRDDFNDLHHIMVHKNKLWIANTGLDRVDVFDQRGRYSGGYALVPAAEEHHRVKAPLPDDPYFANENADTPLHRRRLPDQVHPNHTAVFGGRVLVTRFSERTIQATDTMETVFETPGHPHDGVVDNNQLWMTCTNGLIIACGWSEDGTRLEEHHRIDVFAQTGRWGWCRGLWVGQDTLLVGLTRITRMPRYRWCERPFEGTQTTALLLHKHTGEFIAEANLNDFGKHPKLFSLMGVGR